MTYGHKTQFFMKNECQQQCLDKALVIKKTPKKPQKNSGTESANNYCIVIFSTLKIF